MRPLQERSEVVKQLYQEPKQIKPAVGKALKSKQTVEFNKLKQTNMHSKTPIFFPISHYAALWRWLDSDDFVVAIINCLQLSHRAAGS